MTAGIGEGEPNRSSSEDHASAGGGSGVNLNAPQSAKNLQTLSAAARPPTANANSSTTGGITYASQDSLPRLPIPELDDTLVKFQARLHALQDETERAETAVVVQEFLKGDGPRLQQALHDYEADGTQSGARIGSYVEEFWNESYLCFDSSVVLNLNPFFVLEEGPDAKISKDQLRRAASLCFASVKLASVLKHESMSPDVFRGAPLCMDQYKALFGSARVATLDSSDDVHVYNDSSHVAVLCQNQFYYFSALWPDSGHVAVDEADILDILRAIQTHADQTDVVERSKTALGVFTSLPRNQWAVARQDLCETQSNQTSLHVIDSALFVLVLDDFVPESVDAAAANVLHGTNQLRDDEIASTMQVGTCLNRWYDKLQLIVCRDGTSGLIFEHSIIDGHTALRFVSDVFAETVISFAESIVDLIHGRGRITHVVEAVVKRAAKAVQSSDSKNALDVLPKKLVFELSESLLDRIYYAETALCDEIHASDTCVLEYKEYGKRLVVANKMSPDAFVQMTILLSYYRLYGSVASMYEPALTKKYFHGRTEAIRGTTPQAKALCEVWCNTSSTAEEKLEALRLATAEHSRLTKEASMGLGVDRHLFALNCLASRKGLNPEFFQSNAWKKLNHTVLSTSNCGNPSLRLFGFGPVVPDGFGIGYIIKDSALSYSVCSKHRQTKRYVRSLRTILDELQVLLRPISSIEVAKERPTLDQVKEAMSQKNSSVGSYGDIWGEGVVDEASPSHLPAKSALVRRASASSHFFSTIREQTSSVELILGVVPAGVNVCLDGQADENAGS